MNRILAILLVGLLFTLISCQATPTTTQSSNLPEAQKMLLTRMDLILAYQLDLVPDAQFSGQGLWGSPRLAENANDLKDDYTYAFYCNERIDIGGTQLKFTPSSRIINTIVVHKSMDTAAKAITNAKLNHPWTYKDWSIPKIGDEIKAWQSDVLNVNSNGTFEVIACFRKGLVLVSFDVSGDARPPQPKQIEDFILGLGKIIVARIP